MKAPILVLLLFAATFSNAEYCGQSGPAVCSPVYYAADSNKLSSIGFDSLPCIVRGIPYNESITIRPDSIPLNWQNQFQWMTASSISIDSIWDLPTGICWATNDSDNHTAGNSWLCLNFTGTTWVPSGVYKANIFAFIDLNVPIIPEIEPWSFYLRVIEPNTACLPHSMLNVEDTREALPNVFLHESMLHVKPSSYPLTITISDLLGRVLKQDLISGNEELKVDVSGIHGTFFVTLQSNQGSSTQRFFK
jgi:hypothetical protein